MLINWEIGKDDWAFKNLAEHVQKELTEQFHVNNAKSGDVNIYLTTATFRKKPPNDKTILHLDGNRWYENFIQERVNE